MGIYIMQNTWRRGGEVNWLLGKNVSEGAGKKIKWREEGENCIRNGEGGIIEMHNV